MADKFGTYTAQLIVSDGTLSSAPSTVTITTQRPKPIANAGSGQTVVVGSTVNLSGSGSSSIDNSPLSYAFTLGRPAGSTASLSGANTISPSFVPDVPGSYTIQLIVNDGSLNSDPATITITATAPAGGPASITANSGTPQNTNLNQAPCAPLTALVKDSSGNPLSGITVTFTAPSSGPSGTFAGSVTTATAVTNGTGIATAPVFTGNGTAGSYAVTASVTGVSTPASFALTNVAGSPPSIMVTSGASQSATAGTSFAAPLAATVTGTQCGNSVIVTFAAPGSGASGTFAGGGTTATVPTNGSGVATSPVFTANSIPGGYSVTASAPGSNQASFPLTNTPMAGSGGITVSSASVGQNLQTAVTLTLAQPAGPGGVQVNVASGDPSRLLVAGRAVDVGQGSLPKPAAIDPGATTTIIFVQGLGSGGTVSITASGSDGSSGTGIISLNPSGFVLFGPSGAGVSSFSTGIGANTMLTVTAARLDSSFNFLEPQPLRAGSSATVPFNVSDTSVGTVSPLSVTLTSQNSSATTQFTAAGTGSTTITAMVPPGYSSPVANMLTATVTASGLTAGNTSVGNNLQTTTNILLNGAAPSSGLMVTVTSNDPSKLLLSKTSGDMGLGSIMLKVPAGQNHTQDFYVQGLAGGGSVTYTADAPGFGNSTGTITLNPSGIVVTGPFGPGAAFPTAIGATPSGITISTVEIDPVQGNVSQQVSGGAVVTINVTSSNTAVGTISTSPVTISGGVSSAVTSFQPLAAGSSTISASTPPGFSFAGSVTANVAKPGISVTDQATVGMNLQIGGTFYLGQAAPAGGVTVTLTSNGSTLSLSSSATAPGSSSVPVMVMVPAGQTAGTFYLQGLASSGSATYTASAPGFQSRTGTINFGPSGLTVGATYGAGFMFPTPATVGTPLPVTVNTVLLDVNSNPVGQPQQLAAGYTINASLTNSAPAVGTAPAQVTITGGTNGTTVQFAPKTKGTTVLSVPTPAGYTPPAGNFSSLTVSVQ